MARPNTSQSPGRTIGLSQLVQSDKTPSTSTVNDPTSKPSKPGAKGRSFDFNDTSPLEAQIPYSKKINFDFLSQLMNDIPPSVGPKHPPKMIDPGYIDHITDEQELLAIASHAQARIQDICSSSSITIDNVSRSRNCHKREASKKYGLSPAILRTNRQIYLEASKVLYKQNTFVVSCFGSLWNSFIGPKEFPSNLNRYSKSRHANLVGLPKHSTVPTFHKVRKWKILVSCHTGGTEPPLEIRNFCREICKTKLSTLKVEVLDVVACQGWAKQFGERYSCTNPWVKVGTRFDMKHVLAPFRLLRKVGSMEFKVDAGEMKHWPFFAEIKSVVQSSTDVDRDFAMYAKVLEYAQSFEQSFTIRYNMAEKEWKFRHLAEAEQEEQISALLRMDMRKRHDINLFKTETPHPVEKALQLAKYSSDENNVEEFKKQRKLIVEFLEPQQQRIMAAHDQLVQYIKIQAKTSLFKATPRNIPDSERIERVEQIKTFLQGTMLLEKYGETFRRDLTPEIEMLAKVHPDLFDSYYQNEDRDEGVARCYRELRSFQNWYVWREGFKKAAEDMVAQYLEIRESRKALFGADRAGADVGCIIDVETWRKDRRLGWENIDVVDDSESDDESEDDPNASLEVEPEHDPEDNPEDDESDDISEVGSDLFEE